MSSRSIPQSSILFYLGNVDCFRILCLLIVFYTPFSRVSIEKHGRCDILVSSPLAEPREFPSLNPENGIRSGMDAIIIFIFILPWMGNSNPTPSLMSVAFGVCSWWLASQKLLSTLERVYFSFFSIFGVLSSLAPGCVFSCLWVSVCSTVLGFSFSYSSLFFLLIGCPIFLSLSLPLSLPSFSIRCVPLFFSYYDVPPSCVGYWTSFEVLLFFFSLSLLDFPSRTEHTERSRL